MQKECSVCGETKELTEFYFRNKEGNYHCNVGLGMFKDDTGLLHSALEYLIKTNNNG